MPPNPSPTMRLQPLAWLALAAAASALFWLLAPVLTPFLIGAILAYALHPLVEQLAARGVPRLLSVLAVEVAMILALLGVVLLIVPILSKEIPLLQAQIPLLADRVNQTLGPQLARWGIDVTLDVQSIKAFALKYLSANADDWTAAALSSARIGGSFMLAILGNVLLVPVVLFYLLIDWPQIVARTQALVPQRQRERVQAFLDECDHLLGQYLRGQLLLMLLLAVFYTAALAVAGFDLALPLGVFTGLAVFVPYIGFGIGLALALLAGVLQFSGLYGVAAVAVVYGVGQLLESLVLTPRLVGERIGLGSLAVIFALLAFGHLFGFVGVLVALPVSAVATVALGRLRAAYLRSSLFVG